MEGLPIQGEYSSRNALPFRQEVAAWLVMIGMACFGTVQLAAVIYGVFFSEDKWLINILKEHFMSTVGLPAAAVASTFVVSIFEITAGPIDIEALGVKFKGAAGPIVLWILCFGAITFAIKYTW